jgi:hypothetical protein
MNFENQKLLKLLKQLINKNKDRKKIEAMD